MLMKPATSAVTAATWLMGRMLPITSTFALASSAEKLPRISGLRTTMYDIAKNVTMPPRTSRDTVEPRSVILK